MTRQPPAAPLPLAARARALGVAPAYRDAWGEEQTVPDTTLARIVDVLAAARAEAPLHIVRQANPAPMTVGAAAGRWHLGSASGPVVDGAVQLPAGLPLGEHILQLDGGAPTRRVIVCPDRCHQPPGFAAGERWWGPVVQVYALRSRRNWGMGDFTDLAEVVELAAAEGAAFVGVNPLHALFPAEPGRVSPYAPSSRVALHPGYLDVEQLTGFDGCEAARERVRAPAFQLQLHQWRESEHVDAVAIVPTKREVARLVFDTFLRGELAHGGPQAAAFAAFRAREAAWLDDFAVFDALSAAGVALPAHGSADALRLAAEHADAVTFAAWLQWQCDEQLGRVAARARACGMPMGLYRDLAVGVSDGGAEVWGRPDLHATGFSAGAPPEPFNPSGQSWGLPPTIPSRLTERGYTPFMELLAANMRHAGALRIDHAMALQRLFWVPVDGGAADGAYVDYPLDDLLALLALESVRHQCVVIGEDLGNVPDGFREALRANGVLSYGPLYFAGGSDGALPTPDVWPADALAVVGTHDLPPWPAWWRGDDIVERAALGLFPDLQRRHGQIIGRATDRVRLLLALEREGLVPEGTSLRPETIAADDSAVVRAVHAFLGRSASRLVGVQLEDVLQQPLGVNLPGSNEAQRPNWRVKLPLPLETWAHDARWRDIAATLRRERGRPGAAAPAQQPRESAVVPRATYRLQLHAQHRFADATRWVPYLAALGVSHVYASPYLKARAGSTHGYDVVDHNALNPEIGDTAEHAAWCDTLAAHGLSQVLDIVPNHMGVLETDNPWWMDVLECGPASVHAATFDIDWRPADPAMTGRVLLPVLGDHCGRVLEAGELKLQADPASGAMALHYYDHHIPLDPRTYPDVFDGSPRPGDTAPPEQVDAVRSLMAAFAALPARDPKPTVQAARARDKVQLRRRLADACRDWPWVRDALRAATARFEGPAGADALDALIGRQAWRLAWWRVAGDEVNYRRFFDINTLAAVRMEHPGVFAETHRTVFRWIDEGRVTGLRIDHPDGLADPRAYFDALQERHDVLRRDRGLPPRALYVAVEKILAEHEHLPADWQVHGDTGYRYANLVNGLFVDPQHADRFERLWEEVSGERSSFDRQVRDAKFEVMSGPLAADLAWLTEALLKVARARRTTRDHSRNMLRDALMQLAAGFTVYRTYVSSAGVSPSDRHETARAAADARRHAPAPLHPVIDFVAETVLGAADEADDSLRSAKLRFATRWQQFTAPVMAKAMEDTAFYRYHRLVSLNDVGGDPRRFGTSVAAFHAVNAASARFRPHTMLGTSTHDSKRSEDVRARLDVLSEIPDAWRDAVLRWQALNRPRAERAGAVISATDEYLLYQTLAGVWPLGAVDDAALAALRERVQAYMVKAVREGKQRSHWTAPDATYEAALAAFVDLLLAHREPNPFLSDLLAWLEPVQRFGCWNALVQQLLKLTSPGVPDLYQGSEGWHFALVDPDNRRPVDFAGLAARLEAVRALEDGDALRPGAADHLVDTLADGALKLLLTKRLLALRARAEALFRDGAYVPLTVDGPAAGHVVAFARSHGGAMVVVVGGRLLSGLTGHEPGAVGPRLWRETSVVLPGVAATGADVLTGRTVTVADGRLRLDTVLVDWPLAAIHIPSPP